MDKYKGWYNIHSTPDPGTQKKIHNFRVVWRTKDVASYELWKDNLLIYLRTFLLVL